MSKKYAFEIMLSFGLWFLSLKFEFVEIPDCFSVSILEILYVRYTHNNHQN